MCNTKSSLVTTITLRNGNIYSKTFIEVSTFRTTISGTNVVHTSGVDIIVVLMLVTGYQYQVPCESVGWSKIIWGGKQVHVLIL
jgi:hypothetical protein